MARQDKVGKWATTIFKDGDYTNIVYHNTTVVKFDTNRIVLNTDGWFTNTTKTRMNQASNEFNLGYHVYQDKGIWYVTFKDTTYVFNNSKITFYR